MVDIEFLREKYGKERTSESVESLIIHLYTHGKRPTEITTRLVAKVYGYKFRSSIDTLLRPFGGLTPLKIKHVDKYDPKVKFNEAIKNLLVGNPISNIDNVYRAVTNGVTLEEMAERLNLSKECVRSNLERLFRLGLVVPVDQYNKDTKHARFKYFLTKRELSPNDLKMLKNIRSKEKFECLMALYMFDELTTLEIADAFKKTPRHISGAFESLLEKGIVESSRGLTPRVYKLSKDAYTALSHVSSYLQMIDKEGFENFRGSIREKVEKVMKLRLAKELEENLRRYELREILEKLEGKYFPDEKIDVIRREVENTEKVLEELGLRKMLEKMQGKELLDKVKFLGEVKEMERKLTYRILIEMGRPSYNGEILEKAKLRDPSISAIEVLSELHELEEYGLIKKLKDGFYSA